MENDLTSIINVLKSATPPEDVNDQATLILESLSGEEKEFNIAGGGVDPNQYNYALVISDCIPICPATYNGTEVQSSSNTNYRATITPTNNLSSLKSMIANGSLILYSADGVVNATSVNEDKYYRIASLSQSFRSSPSGWLYYSQSDELGVVHAIVSFVVSYNFNLGTIKITGKTFTNISFEEVLQPGVGATKIYKGSSNVVYSPSALLSCIPSGSSVGTDLGFSIGHDSSTGVSRTNYYPKTSKFDAPMAFEYHPKMYCLNTLLSYACITASWGSGAYKLILASPQINLTIFPGQVIV